MEISCIRHTDLPHASRLFTDFLYHYDRVATFYGHRPLSPSSYRAAIEKMHYPDERRAALVRALRRSNEDSPLLELLAQPDTVAVVTGQQVGLFSGPAYTIYKALTAARIAHQLTEQGIRAVPVFWLATEDHDFEEVNHCRVFDEQHRPVLLQVPNGAGNQTPVGTIPLRDVPVAALRQALSGFPFGDSVAAAVEEAYVPGQTLGAAFANLLKRLLARYGFVFLDPMTPEIRELTAPVLRKALDAAPDLTAKLLARNRELEQKGYHAQVHVEPETSLFFLLENGKRLTLRRSNNHYTARDRRFTAEELKDLADHISPNALLRPVVQDYILPTVAYTAGPAELAYFAQSEVLYETLLGRMPVSVPRSGFTLIDDRTLKLMKRYHLSFQDVLRGEAVVRDQIARNLVPPALKQRFGETVQSVARDLDRLREDLKAFDVTLAAALEKSRAKILYQLSKNERKAANEALRRDERAANDAAWISGLIYPQKHLQERYYSILPFLARHGLDLVDRLYENVHLECPDHLVIHV